MKHKNLMMNLQKIKHPKVVSVNQAPQSLQLEVMTN